MCVVTYTWIDVCSIQICSDIQIDIYCVVEAVRKMAQIAHSYGKQCKASGGIRDGVTAKQMIEAGIIVCDSCEW